MQNKKSYTAVRDDGLRIVIWAKSRLSAQRVLKLRGLTSIYTLEEDLATQPAPTCVKSCYGFDVPVD
jgi:hypothetical protein